MTTCPQCGAETTGLETCPECGQSVETAEATEETPADVTEETPAATSSSKRFSWRIRRPVAIAAGIGVLGLVIGGLAGFGVGHAETSDDGGTTAAAGALSLPGTLTGGYKRSKTVDSEIASSVSSAQDTLGAATDMALYTHKKKQVLVEATRLPGQAFLNAGMTYAKVGDAVCATVSGTSGSEAICTRTSDALTVHVTAVDSATASKYTDEVYAALV